MAKIFFLPIAMKLASIIENGLLIIYHQGQKKRGGRSPFSTKRVEKVDFTSKIGCHANYDIHESPQFSIKFYSIIWIVFIEMFRTNLMKNFDHKGTFFR